MIKASMLLAVKAANVLFGTVVDKCDYLDNRSELKEKRSF